MVTDDRSEITDHPQKGEVITVVDFDFHPTHFLQKPWRGFSLRGKAIVLQCSMSFRSIGIAGIIFSMVLGCAANPSVSKRDTADWRAQKERQQRVAREAGRIGYVGNLGPAVGGSPRP